MGERLSIKELRAVDSYQPLDATGAYAPEGWPTLRTTGELAAFKTEHNRPMGPVYFKRPAGNCMELVCWYPGQFRVLGREYAGETQLVEGGAWMGSPVKGE